MEIKQLEYFLAVSETKSFTRAAERLFVSQPSVTNIIRSLEDELGIQLFERSQKQMLLTSEGRIFHSHVEHLMKGISHTLEEIAAIKNLNGGELHLGVAPFGVGIVCSDFLPSFAKSYSEIHVTLTENSSNELQKQLHEGTLDLAVVTMGDELPSRLDFLPLTGYDMLYCVGPHHPLREAKTVSLRETAQYPMIYFSGGYYQQHLLESSFRALQIQPEVLFHSNQLTTIKSFIREDIAGGFLMPQILQEEDRITAIPVQEEQRLNVAVVWRKDDYLTKEAKSFISFCRKTFEAS